MLAPKSVPTPKAASILTVAPPIPVACPSPGATPRSVSGAPPPFARIDALDELEDDDGPEGLQRLKQRTLQTMCRAAETGMLDKALARINSPRPVDDADPEVKIRELGAEISKLRAENEALRMENARLLAGNYITAVAEAISKGLRGNRAASAKRLDVTEERPQSPSKTPAGSGFSAVRDAKAEVKNGK